MAKELFMILRYCLYIVSWLGYLCSCAYIILFKGTLDNTRDFLQALHKGEVIQHQKVYLLPFESTSLFIRNWEYAYARWNVFGNMLLFLPFGFLLGFIVFGKKGAFINWGLSFCVSLSFELIQYLYGIGEFDVDDIMLNVAGAMLGYFLISMARGIWKHVVK